MKKIAYFFLFLFLSSCTSNTIFEKPKDLIPKDTMSLLIQEMAIANASKYVKNKNLKKGIDYMSLVYNRFKIDSTRFSNSNLYYMSKIDEYQDILDDAEASLQKQKTKFNTIKKVRDSLTNDSIQQAKKIKIKTDSLKLKKQKSN